MPDKRVSMFVSHKVANHERAAQRIKTILESRAERLDIYICEDIPAGDRWREWIKDNIAHSHILLVLLPHTGADLTWLATEIAQFQAVCPNGRLVVLNPPSQPIPSILADRQVIATSKDQLLERFLDPLYRDPEFVCIDAPLNRRITDIDLRRDAEEIEQALLGLIDVNSVFFGESLIVETSAFDVAVPASLDNAPVRAPNGCSQILNWSKRYFLWRDLRARAAEEKGKGTFWVREMEQVIIEVARQNTPRIMTSTFRGRGPVAGQIFRPQLESVDFVGDTPIRYHFFFHEVLVPELVRGPERIGDVFNLLHIASRVRWEVLNPFLIKLFLAKNTSPARLDMSEEARYEIIGQVIRSLRIIEQEVERHNMLDSAISAFEGTDRELMVQLLEERERIHIAIDDAAQGQNFDTFIDVLKQALDLNGRAMELLASRFLELVREDCGEVKQMLQQLLPKTAPLQ